MDTNQPNESYETDQTKHKFMYLVYHDFTKLAYLVSDDCSTQMLHKNINLCGKCKRFFWKTHSNLKGQPIMNDDILNDFKQRGKDIIHFVDNLPNSFYNDGPSLMIENFIPVCQNLRDFVYISPSCDHPSEFISVDEIDDDYKALISPMVKSLSLSTNRQIEISLENLKNPLFNQMQFGCNNLSRRDEILSKFKVSIETPSNFIIFIRSKNFDIANILCNNVSKIPHFMDVQREFFNRVSIKKCLEDDFVFGVIPTFLNAQSLLEDNGEFRQIFVSHKGPIIFQTNFDHSLSDFAFSLANETIVDSRT